MTAARRNTGAGIVDIDDAGLVLRARSGDMNSFEALYRRYVARVFGLCVRMVGDPGLAEDITQDVFVRAWEKLHLFRGDGALAPWLLALAANVVKSHWRSNKSRTDRESPMELLENTGTVNASSSGEPVANVDLERAIRGLPEGARKVFVLHDIEGFRHREIAGMLGIATGTTKAQLHRARQMLREVLES